MNRNVMFTNKLTIIIIMDCSKLIVLCKYCKLYYSIFPVNCLFIVVLCIYMIFFVKIYAYCNKRKL